MSYILLHCIEDVKYTMHEIMQKSQWQLQLLNMEEQTRLPIFKSVLTLQNIKLYWCKARNGKYENVWQGHWGITFIKDYT